MADRPSTDIARQKARIISHMNSDHHESIVLYLRHYCELSSHDSKSGQLEDIGLDSILLRTTKSRYIVPLRPPMASLTESRKRLVEMDREATEALGLSKIVVGQYAMPSTPVHIITFFLASFGWVMNSSSSNFRQDSLFGGIVLRGNKTLCTILEQAQPWILALMIIIHVWEMFYFDSTRLQKHRVPRFGLLWFLWSGSCFIEGIGAFQRFDSLVRCQQASEEKKRRSH